MTATRTLYTIIVSRTGHMKDHPYWREGAFVALSENDWGPRYSLKMADHPVMFLTEEAAQRVIDEYPNDAVPMNVQHFIEY
jgi:hypothetical protein